MNDPKHHHYTLGQAAKATGKSKSTLLSAIKNGRISYISKDNNGYQIDPSELHRVYPPVSEHPEPNEAEQGTTPLALELEKLKTELFYERERVRDTRVRLEQVEKDKEEWRKQATYLIEDKSKIDEKQREREDDYRTVYNAKETAERQMAQMQEENKRLRSELSNSQGKIEKARRNWLGRLLVG